ncbi:HET-domain-containing protein [Hypoxylon argillaceum]|nr:HET-domain-containing protein [Hypoxylon argillaceum]
MKSYLAMLTTNLCDFCRSLDWEQLLTGVFNPKRAALENGQVKCGEHNLGSIRSNEDTCELCRLIGRASLALKPWWPIAEFLDQPERIECAFFNGRNRLGSDVLTGNISQTQLLLDQMSAQLNPSYSSLNLLKQELFDSLARHGGVNGPESATGEPRKNNSLNYLLVLAGLTPVKATAQTFMQLHPCLHPLPTVQDYVNGTCPSTVFPTGRIVQPEVNIELLGKWYNACLQNHGTACEQPSWLAPAGVWPRNLRLIDVTQRCIVDAPTECPYFALSYVWGSEQDPLQSTTQNLATLKVPGALHPDSLPKTIEDALWLTREMGVSYLWIDRLCVIQDSDADKAIQLPQMDLMYSGAALTIVAASGTALDGLAGINNTPRTIDQRMARVTENLSVMNVLRLDQEYQNCVWRTRGWTFQEGLCSRRSLVITADQVFWSCETTRCCEAIAFEDFPTTVRPGDVIWQVLSGHRVFGEFGGANFNYGELQSMIATYNKRHLSIQGDILNAFTGVLNRVSHNSGHDFYWGHSVSCMFDLSLAWVNTAWSYNVEPSDLKVPTRRRDTHRVFPIEGPSYEVPFPSWSWLGWVYLEGLGRSIPKQVTIAPELNIMKLDIYGKAAALNASGRRLEDLHKVNMYGIDASTSASWKQDTAISPHLLHDGDSFRDSGRLRFWTSHAHLEIKERKIYSSSAADVEIGRLLSLWPHQIMNAEGTFSFIVVSRTLDDFRYNDVRAHRKLYLLLVDWVNCAEHIAERVCAAEVDEAAWVNEGSREWILVTLA